MILPSDLEVTDADRVDFVTAQVRGYCGWHISPSVTQTVTLDSDGGKLLTLPSLHVTAVTSITIGGTAVDMATVKWSANGLVQIADCSYFAYGYRNVVVTFTHGWPETPMDLRAAMTNIVKRAAVTDGLIVQETFGPFSKTYSSTAGGPVSDRTGYATAEELVLNRYRILNRP